MKAICVHETGGPEVLLLEEAPDPIPGPGQVVVKVSAAGVNPVDTYFRAGTTYKPDLPFTPGMDAAGIVDLVGRDVKNVKEGDRVYVAFNISGAYAQKVLCKEAQVHSLPDAVTFAQGAAVGIPYATAYRALFQRAHGIPGDSVLVHGASGGVGTAAVQIARAAGFTVTGTAGTPRGLKLVDEQGAHYTLDHSTPDFLEKAMAVTDGRGFDIVLEMLANVNLNTDFSLLAHGGRIVVIGNRGTVEINPRDIMKKDAAVLGMLLSAVSDEALARCHSAIAAGLENGTLRPVIGQEIPLAEAPRAHEAVMQPGAYGKIVLIP